jgi:hypothetical protein
MDSLAAVQPTLGYIIMYKMEGELMSRADVKSPLYSLSMLWNSLDDTRFQQCKRTFRICLKNKLIDELD